jgi:hypothetical protein
MKRYRDFSGYQKGVIHRMLHVLGSQLTTLLVTYLLPRTSTLSSQRKPRMILLSDTKVPEAHQALLEIAKGKRPLDTWNTVMS